VFKRVTSNNPDGSSFSRRSLRLVLSVVCFVAIWCARSNALDPSLQLSQYGHTAWRVRDGAFSGAPNAIAQTTDGYLWIGTQAGLVRFDGVQFVPWIPPEGMAFPSPVILSLLGSTDGSLWIGTASGLARWKNGHLIKFPETAGHVNSIYEDRQGTIWIGRSRNPAGGVCQIAASNVRCYGPQDNVPPYGGPVIGDDAGNIWIGSATALVRWKAGSSTLFSPSGLKSSEALAGVSALAAAADGSLWVGMVRSGRGLGLQHFIQGNWQTLVTPTFNASDLNVNGLWLDRRHSLWIATEGDGIYRVHDGKVDRFRSADGLSSDSVSGFFEDREGNLWTATAEGIDRFRDIQVVSFSTHEGLSGDRVGSVAASRDGTVWIGNRHALDSVRGESLSSIGRKNGLPGQRVTSLLEDHTGMLWVGIDNGLYIFERGKFTPITRDNGSPTGAVVAMTEDVDHNLWVAVIGNPRGILRIQGRKIRQVIADPRISHALALASDPQSGIWLASDKGELALYRNSELQIFPFNFRVSQLVVNSEHSVLAATNDGLVEWRDGNLHILDIRNGMPCKNIYTFVFDQQANLWLYAECGLIKITADQLRKWQSQPEAKIDFHNFDVFDGALPVQASFRPTAARSVDGRLWFANENVVQMIDPDHLTSNPLAPPVLVEKIVADRKSYLPGKDLRLPALTRDLEIDYTALSFVVPQKVRFRYKLEGHDLNWQDPQVRRQAFYTNLRPGNYRFRVIACNNDGVWNEAGASLNFILLPAFYQTQWFLILCGAASLCLAWFIHRWRLRLATARLDSQYQERLAERTLIGQDLHDTLLQGALSAFMQLNIANDQLAADAPAKPLVVRVLELLSGVVKDGRETVQGLRLSKQGLQDLEQAFLKVPQELAAQGTADFHVIVEGSPRGLRPIVRDEVYRIGREAVTNAFRHSGATRVEVAVEYHSNHLRLVVSDNGSGIDAKVLHSGRDGHWGLSGMRERAEKIGAKLKVLSNDEGTAVELVVPAGIAFEGPATGSGSRWLVKHPRKTGTES
jgi:signal transduction histidine kinase